MDDEALISLVRSHPAFYDVTDPGYSDNIYKQQAWRHIATELNVDVAICKARWNNIRDNYRKSLKKNVARCAQAKKTTHYKYADQLGFLVEFFEERADRSLSEMPHEEEYDCNIVEELEEEPLDIKPAEISESLTEFNESFQFQPISSLVPEGKPRKRIKLARNNSYSKVPVPIAERSVEYRSEDSRDSTSTGPQSPHPVDAFLAGIAPTLKSFSPYYLNLVKSEIFAAVQKFEMKMLEQQLGLGKSASRYNQDVTMAPCTSRSDSTSSPKESYDEDD